MLLCMLMYDFNVKKCINAILGVKTTIEMLIVRYLQLYKMEILYNSGQLKWVFASFFLHFCIILCFFAVFTFYQFTSIICSCFLYITVLFIIFKNNLYDYSIF